MKESQKLNKLHQRKSNIRKDYLNKLTTLLVSVADYICLEDLDIEVMMKNHHIAKHLSDLGLYEFKRQLMYKGAYASKKIVEANRFYPSSKTCSNCGTVISKLALNERIYKCDDCGLKINRDYNASLNLLSYLTNEIGQVLPEFTPADLTAMQLLFDKNNIVTSKVEPGIQQKCY
ncbi:MAG: transposase [Acholeplasmataceae bacterium]|nr:transposase [Acholeplasmataceae bacterium]